MGFHNIIMFRNILEQIWYYAVNQLELNETERPTETNSAIPNVDFIEWYFGQQHLKVSTMQTCWRRHKFANVSE